MTEITTDAFPYKFARPRRWNWTLIGFLALNFASWALVLGTFYAAWRFLFEIA